MCCDINLPEGFRERMKALLGDEYDDFAASYDKPAAPALRVNTCKCSAEDVSRLLGVPLTPVPWSSDGYYYPADLRPGKSPYHEAGLYYIQEASAMLVAAMAAAAPGERVLDLCAAPGGKTTALAASMKGEGLLVANEIHPGRASILSQNVERMGIPHSIVTNEPPEALAAAFPDYFDLIVVDAPCSGEGMFRKEPQALDIWSLDNIHMCAERQQDILAEAAKMLRPGGRLVYSTCTFAPEENEESVSRFISSRPDFSLLEQRRLWPHKVDGEGHFAALLRREGSADPSTAGRTSSRRRSQVSRDRMKLWQAWADENLARDPSAGGTLITFGDNLYLLPADIPLSGLRVLRPGLQLGTFVRDRFEPAHALALSLRPEDARASVSLDCDAAAAYISGLSVPDEAHRGWVLVCVDGYSLAWGKSAAGTCKNHYPKGLRRQL